ncbi:hypothetical protein ACH5A3_23190 [Streptomyces echinatus]|uniref:hypothetical protein n=1 Tax=Streptomyces echinatus TaxID=67293 RepID=UPI00379F79F7
MVHRRAAAQAKAALGWSLLTALHEFYALAGAPPDKERASPRRRPRCPSACTASRGSR